MKVYAAMFYGVDEAEIDGVFSTCEKAQAYIDQYQAVWKHYYSVVECELDHPRKDVMGEGGTQ